MPNEMDPDVSVSSQFGPTRHFPQARARATYEALLDAARDVFSERGFDAAQTPEIAARAGVSVGSFYRYFRDKRQIFVEMIGHHLAQGWADVMPQLTAERLRGEMGSSTVDRVLDLLTAHLGREPRLHRLLVEMSLRDDEVAALRARFEALAEHRLSELIAELTPRAVAPDPHAAAHVVVVAAIEVAASCVGLRPRDRQQQHPLDGAAVRDALGEMLRRYVLAGDA